MRMLSSCNFLSSWYLVVVLVILCLRVCQTSLRVLGVKQTERQWGMIIGKASGKMSLLVTWLTSQAIPHRGHSKHCNGSAASIAHAGIWRTSQINIKLRTEGNRFLLSHCDHEEWHTPSRPEASFFVRPRRSLHQRRFVAMRHSGSTGIGVHVRF